MQFSSLLLFPCPSVRLLFPGLPEGLVHVQDDDRVHHDDGRDRRPEEVPRRLDLVVVLENHLDPEEGQEGKAEHQGRVEVQACN